jgi:hypothetical protein
MKIFNEKKSLLETPDKLFFIFEGRQIISRIVDNDSVFLFFSFAFFFIHGMEKIYNFN